jgi:hypothetical protein
MATLKAAARNALPASSFALPASRKYPIENASHARNAKARASEMEAKGKISAGTKAKIDARANAKLKG